MLHNEGLHIHSPGSGHWGFAFSARSSRFVCMKTSLSTDKFSRAANCGVSLPYLRKTVVRAPSVGENSWTFFHVLFDYRLQFLQSPTLRRQHKNHSRLAANAANCPVCFILQHAFAVIFATKQLGFVKPRSANPVFRQLFFHLIRAYCPQKTRPIDSRLRVRQQLFYYFFLFWFWTSVVD